MEYVGFDSFTNYNWACVNINIDDEYSVVTDSYMGVCREYDTWDTPFYPNITIGWDNNIRFKDFKPGIIKNNTPEEFEVACKKIKEHTDYLIENKKIIKPLITVNSWNEWTETSYLEPDDLYGYSYLDVIKKVFG